MPMTSKGQNSQEADSWERPTDTIVGRMTKIQCKKTFHNEKEWNGGHHYRSYTNNNGMKGISGKRKTLFLSFNKLAVDNV